MAAKARKRRQGRREPRGGGWIYLAAAGVAVAAAIVSGVLLFARDSDDDSRAQVAVPTPGLPGLLRQGRILGQPDAPVSIIEYADFQ